MPKLSSAYEPWSKLLIQNIIEVYKRLVYGSYAVALLTMLAVLVTLIIGNIQRWGVITHCRIIPIQNNTISIVDLISSFGYIYTL